MENPYKALDEHIGEIMTYPALCRLIGENAKSGKGRELHLKNIAQYVNIDRESVPRKLVIREVYLPDNFKLNKPKRSSSVWSNSNRKMKQDLFCC